jgi:hypothetical protein
MGGPAGSIPDRWVRVNVNCDLCRAAMCTDGLLSKLRCAECQEIKFEQLWNAVVKGALFATAGYLLFSLLRRNAGYSAAGLAPITSEGDGTHTPPQRVRLVS